MRYETIFLLALALGGGACAHKSASDSSYDEYDATAAPTAATDESYAMDAEMDAPMAKESGNVRFGSRRADRKAAREVMASPAATSPGDAGGAPEPAPVGASAGDGAEPAVANDMPDDVGRHIVYVASMSLSVFNLEDAMAAAEALPDKYGGYIASMSASSIVLRIPSKNLRPIMGAVGDLGVVESRSMTAQDVTDEYYDVESRISALEKTHAQMLELLGKARNVQEALEVRRALDEISLELEVLKGRMRKLQNMISFSTLSLSLVERGPFTPTPSSNDPFPWVDGLGVEATEWK
jgi:hypothetical protein